MIKIILFLLLVMYQSINVFSQSELINCDLIDSLFKIKYLNSFIHSTNDKLDTVCILTKKKTFNCDYYFANNNHIKIIISDTAKFKYKSIIKIIDISIKNPFLLIQFEIKSQGVNGFVIYRIKGNKILKLVDYQIGET